MNKLKFISPFEKSLDNTILTLLSDPRNQQRALMLALKFCCRLTTQAVLPVILLIPLPFGPANIIIRILFVWLWGIVIQGWWEKEIIPLLKEETDQLESEPIPLLPQENTPVVPGLLSKGLPEKTYSWKFSPTNDEDIDFSVGLSINQDRYEAAKTEERRKQGDWSYYSAKDMPEIRNIAKDFYTLHADRNWSTFDQAANVLSFTQQCVQYKFDKDTTPADEWPRYPIETLMDEVGDCEDDSILAAAILKRLGFEVALLYYPRHCALGVGGAKGLPGNFIQDKKSDISYFYGETTANGWKLGEIPSKYSDAEPEKIEPIKSLIDFEEDETEKSVVPD